MASGKNIVKSVSLISITTLLSRILGFVRDSLFANFLGATNVADAFFVAFKIPNLLRRLFAEGALSSLFITIFSDLKENEGEERAWKFASSVVKIFIVILLLLSVVGVIFAKELVQLMTLSFSGGEKFQLTVLLTRIMFPYIFFISLVSIEMGILNSYHHFFLPAFSPVILNIFFIVALLLGALYHLTPERMAILIGIFIILGGIVQVLFQIPKVISLGFRFFKGNPLSDNKVILLFKRMVPAVFSMAITQVNIFVDTILAWSLGEGAVSALYYGNRLLQFPLGVFGVSLSRVSLSLISSYYAQKKIKKFSFTLNRTLRLMFLILIPAMVGFWVIKIPIIKVIFERGAFTTQATLITSQVLLMYSFGLVAYSGVNIITPAFYALGDTKTPMICSSLAMVSNIILNIVLMRYFGVSGLALATSLSGWVNLILILYFYYQKGLTLYGKSLLVSFVKIFFISLLMGGSILLLKPLVWGNKYFVLFELLLSGVLVYIILLKLFRVRELREFGLKGKK